MELALSAKRRLGFVTGKTAKPKEDEDEIEAWMVNNNQVITWILKNVSERIKMVIIYTSTAKGIWDVLEKRYTITNGARKFKLNKETYEISQQGRFIEEYYTQLQMVWDELDNMNTLPTISKITTDVAEYLRAMETQAEEKRLFQFLNGLDKEYGILRSSILLMDPLPTVENAVSLMLQEEVQTGNLGGNKHHEMSALMSKGEYDKDKCTHCGRDNHKSEMCWEIRGYPVGHPKHKKPYHKINYKGNSGGNFRQQRGYQGNSRPGNNMGEGRYHKQTAANARSENTDLSSAIGAATQQLENLLKMVPANNNTYKPGGDSEEEIECNFEGMIHHLNHKGHKIEWVIDSGATDHMSPYLDIMTNVEVVNEKPKINLPNGGSVKVSHRGDVKLNNGIVLRKVLYRLVKDSKCEINGKTMRLGEAINGLYYLRDEGVPKMTNRETDKDRSSKRSNCSYTLAEWHAPWSKLKFLNHLKLTANKEGMCLSCPMAKFTKLLFSQRQNTATNPFDLIHIDIWGPYRVPYRGKYRYFLTIVDDLSRGTWAFYELVLTQHGKRIKIIRSDNALEFDDEQCRKLFLENGIIHQTSIVDRPQQNGVVERKHRHLLEISRALRFHSGIPLSYWGDCVLTAAYIINRLPSSVNKNMTPYECIHGRKANYKDLKVFGCLAMAYNPERNKDKFQPRGLPCIFLGYPAHRRVTNLRIL
ncbi:hypothetical protein RND81_12G006000 [Saponaria officinalis]|uniref:Integrase catalytic domain-containing protein n=1 Tax=Saponaria officinalis TaxID=3572 RepID=A0AAW1H683_SAPOF